MSPKVDEIVELLTPSWQISALKRRNHQAHERHICHARLGPNAGGMMACESLVNTFLGLMSACWRSLQWIIMRVSAKAVIFKSRNVDAIDAADEGAMQRYLADCHQRGVLEMLPSLVDSPWCALAIDVSVCCWKISRYSVSDYDESASQHKEALAIRSAMIVVDGRASKDLIGVRFSQNCRAGLCGHDYSLRHAFFWQSRAHYTHQYGK